MIVIDTSVAVKWVVQEAAVHREDQTEIALSLFDRELVAPDCILGEFANALFKKVQRGEIGMDQARQAVDILPQIIEFVPSAPLVPAALEWAHVLAHPVHDCLFLTLAIQNGLLLVTADEKFVDRCDRHADVLPIRTLHSIDR